MLQRTRLYSLTRLAFDLHLVSLTPRAHKTLGPIPQYRSTHKLAWLSSAGLAPDGSRILYIFLLRFCLCVGEGGVYVRVPVFP